MSQQFILTPKYRLNVLTMLAQRSYSCLQLADLFHLESSQMKRIVQDMSFSGLIYSVYASPGRSSNWKITQQGKDYLQRFNGSGTLNVTQK